MKTILGKCKKCGDVEVTHFENQDGVLSVPVELCPTMKDLQRYYKDMVGATYFENTGNSVKKSFEKDYSEPSHLSPDDVGHDLMKEHTLEPIEVWQEIY